MDAGEGEPIVLDRLWKKQSTAARYRATVFGPCLDDYLEVLRRCGYGLKVLRRNLALIARLGEYLAEEGVRDVGSMKRKHIAAFLERERTRLERTSGAPARQASVACHVVDGLQRHLEARGVLRGEEPPAPSLMGEFYRSLATERGLQASTIEGYQHFVGQFLCHLGSDGSAKELSRLTVQDIDGFIVAAGRTYSRRSMGHVCTAVRGLLRHLYRVGVMERDLSAVVIHPWFYALERLPCALPWETMRRVLDAIDRTTATGRRDLAILMLLVTYGVRPGEVVKLRLEDVDWRHDVIRFRRSKSGRPLSFPLTRNVGEAIVAYLRHGRPPTDAPEIFIRTRAPLLAFHRGSAVSGLVRQYLARAGIESRHTGAYVIRHSLAVHLLRKQHPLKTITDVLGHRDPHVAFQYTKLDVDDLRDVAIEAREVLP
jgi:integrase/recombinase XerD